MRLSIRVRIVLACLAAILPLVVNEVSHLLERMVRAARPHAYATFILPGGQVGASVPPEIVASGLNLADPPFFQALRAGDEWRPINLTQSPVRGIPVWGVAAGVRPGNRFLGAVGVTVAAVDFDRLISVKMPAGSWSIVDARGRLVYLNGKEGSMAQPWPSS